MEEIKIYRNSVNYIPIDVAKGICTGLREYGSMRTKSTPATSVCPNACTASTLSSTPRESALACVRPSPGMARLSGHGCGDL